MDGDSMDPNEALRVIRSQVTAILSGTGGDATELCESVDGLDRWLTTGGFLPSQWTGVNA